MEEVKAPIRILLKYPEVTEKQYLSRFSQAPENIKRLLSSGKIGSFILGILRENHIPDSKYEKVIFLYLSVFLGIKEWKNFESSLVSEVGVPTNAAANVSRQIEQELFAPVAMEYNQYLEKLKSENTTAQSTDQSTTSGPAAGVRNVLDLKTQEQTKRPPLTLPSISDKPTGERRRFNY